MSLLSFSLHNRLLSICHHHWAMSIDILHLLGHCILSLVSLLWHLLSSTLQFAASINRNCPISLFLALSPDLFPYMDWSLPIEDCLFGNWNCPNSPVTHSSTSSLRQWQLTDHYFRLDTNHQTFKLATCFWTNMTL